MLTRRQAIKRGLVGAGALAVTSRAPAYAAARPDLLQVQTSDPTATTATLWARADRAARLVVEVNGTRVTGPVLDPAKDTTGRVVLPGLPPGRWSWFQAFAEDTTTGVRSWGQSGWVRTAPARRQQVKFVWGGDVCGQGWGIDTARGGLRIFEAMRSWDPHLYLCAGDAVYADQPLAEWRELGDGTRWTNLVTPAKAKVAETLAEFRGQYAYAFEDPWYHGFASEVPTFNLWDDHDVHDNWWPGQVLWDDRYTERRVDVLAARARRASTEWSPSRSTARYRKVAYGPLLDVFLTDGRSFRNPNDSGTSATSGPGVLGETQLQWLIGGLKASTATWKVIVLSQPVGVHIDDGPTAVEGFGQGDHGAPRGREHEVARLLRAAHEGGFGRNLVVLTADVHHAAAHRYDPARGSAGEFTPFWELVAGPLHAGSFTPYPMDRTFGPQVVWRRHPAEDGAGPTAGFQHFGAVEIAGDTGVMSVSLRSRTGTVLWSKDLVPGSLNPA